MRRSASRGSFAHTVVEALTTVPTIVIVVACLAAPAGAAATVRGPASRPTSPSTSPSSMNAIHIQAASAGSRTVSYGAYTVTVPAGWPVINLAAEQTRCVRFNRHALYLGVPGAEEHCPAHAAGRTEAILVEPLQRSSGEAITAGQADILGRARIAESENGAVAPRRWPPDAASRVTFALKAARVVITATWGRDPGLIQRVLLSARVAHAATAVGNARERKPVPAAKALGLRPSRRNAPRLQHSGRIQPALSGHSTTFTGLGFDTCAAPSTSQMAAWSTSPYRAVGIYIGGTNAACVQANLSSSWVSTELAAGWRLIPTYVGLQAPGSSCSGCVTMASSTSQDTAEGISAANDAVSEAKALGIGPGNPIYFDMEAYTTGPTATPYVLAFIKAWTSQLHADGYTSGVYSSAASGITDLVYQYGTGYLEPDDIWIADWNNQQTTQDPYVPNGDWSSNQRLHQYAGGHNETYGNVTLNIDSDYLAGAVVGQTLPNGTFVSVAGQPAIYEIAGGAPLYVTSWAAVGGPHAIDQLSAAQFAALDTAPATGTLIEGWTTKNEYTIVDGAPQYLAGHVGSPLIVDQAAIDHAGQPGVWSHLLHAVGYYMVGSDGGVFSFGEGSFYGSMGAKPLNAPIVGTATTPSGAGYWFVASDGGIFSFGDAKFYGSMGSKPLNKPIVSITLA